MGFNPGGGGGGGAIGSATDVALNSLATNQVLTYDGGIAKWKNAAAGSVSLASLPAGSVIYADGAASARPTSRTDLRCIWTSPTNPVNAIAGDIWLNGAL